jgi:hypothetical protein
LGLSVSAARVVSSFLKVAALASLSVAACLAVLSFASGNLNQSPGALLLGFFLAVAVAFPIVATGGLIFGVPVHLLLARGEKTDLATYLIAGVLTGVFAGVVLLGPVFLGAAIIPRAAALGAVAGGVSSLVWWKLQVAESSELGVDD